MHHIWAKKALTAEGWQSDVLITINNDGLITSLETSASHKGTIADILLPAPTNLHSHTFQRAMAGSSEQQGPRGRDNFWTWRQLMFRFVDQLTPDDIAAISAFVQMEMLEAGYAASCEFHYIHHQRDGTPYDNIAEMSEAIIAAASTSGIGLTLLPVLYQYGGCDKRPLTGGQRRFGNTEAQFGRLFEKAAAVKTLANHPNFGIAPHSLRATSEEGLAFAVNLAPDRPIHMHLAEQVGEVEEVLAARGRRPVEWLLENHKIDRRWCLIHLTHMNDEETRAMARTGAVAGLCPMTESNLGDGIFNGRKFLDHGGRFGIGSDSNIHISLSEELRTFEYSQRLRDKSRAVLATPDKSAGRVLLEGAARGGAQAAGRNCGTIDVGKLADLLSLDGNHTDLFLKQDDEILDSFIFAGDDRMVVDVWSAGQHLVSNGQHIAHEQITKQYHKTLASLKERI